MDTPKSHPGITLYRGFKISKTYVWSPFVTKLEARLRFSLIPYKVEEGSPFKSPRGKIPYVSLCSKLDSKDVIMMSDSSLIIKKLVDEGAIEDLHGGLDSKDKVFDAALCALLEEKLYFFNGYEKWHENYYTMRSHILSSLPYPVQIILGLVVYRKNMTTLYGQGTARFTSSEIRSFREKIWEDLEVLLFESRKKSEGSKTPFWVLTGDKPTEIDAVLFGFVTSALVCYAAPDTQVFVRNLPVLMDYARRIHDCYFPDYEVWE